MNQIAQEIIGNKNLSKDHIDQLLEKIKKYKEDDEKANEFENKIATAKNKGDLEKVKQEIDNEKKIFEETASYLLEKIKQKEKKIKEQEMFEGFKNRFEKAEKLEDLGSILQEINQNTNLSKEYLIQSQAQKKKLEKSIFVI